MKYRLALVTGASSGIGEALCKLLASREIALVITARSKEKLEAIAKELQVPVVCHTADLSKPESRKTLIALIHELKPDLIINNGGFGLYGDALKHTTQEQMEILEVNGNALLEISLESARVLAQEKMRGTIMNISSAAAFFVYPTFAVYASAKAFVLQFSRSFDAEMSPLGIRVLCSCPGQIETHFSERASKGESRKKNKNHTMSVEKAAELIWDQIERQKSFEVIDSTYKWMTFLARFFIPQKLLQILLKKS